MRPSLVKELCIEKYDYYHPNLDIVVAKDNNSVSILANLKNYIVILTDRYQTLRFCEFNQTPFVGENKITQNMLVEFETFLLGLLKGSKIFPKDVLRAVIYVARQRSFSSVQEYFTGLPRTETHHLDNWLHTICSVKDTKLNRVLGKKWLIGAVARAMTPGCATEGSLVLYGGEAKYKSTLFRSLNPKPEWACDSAVDISDTMKASQAFRGKFLIEFAEVADLNRIKMERVKQFLTSPRDTYTPKYENISIDVPRAYICGGTTNEPDILSEIENRRFWCVEVLNEINIKQLELIKDELWAEAYEAWISGETCWLNGEERDLLQQNNNANFKQADPLLQELIALLVENTQDGQEVSVKEIKGYCNSISRKEVHPKQLSKMMRELGWVHKHKMNGAHYVRPIGWMAKDAVKIGEVSWNEGMVN
jgi:predicted P-loop ATPase